MKYFSQTDEGKVAKSLSAVDQDQQLQKAQASVFRLCFLTIIGFVNPLTLVKVATAKLCLFKINDKV